MPWIKLKKSDPRREVIYLLIFSIVVVVNLLGIPTVAWSIPIYNYQELIVAGDPNGTPPDSPDNRVDPNTTTSPFAGVGSLSIGGSFLCSGAAISLLQILTAAHCLDLNDNGTVDVLPFEVVFNLNFGGDLTQSIPASSLVIHPDFTGFNNPVINDDIAIVTLESELPIGVPIYDLYVDPLLPGTTLTMVGYGESGDGINGFTVNGDFSIKRVGKNNADTFNLDDEGSGINEVFFFDFDGPTGNGFSGGPTLGNDIETMLGPGDSGSPSFIQLAGEWFLAGVNTFGIFTNTTPGTFGNRGGGMVVPAYADWIASQIISGGGGGPGPEPIPEPASLILFGVGAVSLPSIRRWRNRCRK